MDDEDDLWSSSFVMEEDTPRKQTLRGCEFWFDFRTDVLEENFQNEKYCEEAWRIFNEKKQDAEIVELEKDSLSLQNDLTSSGSGDSLVLPSSDSDKTLSATLPNTDTSSPKSSLCEDENTSSISDAQTTKSRDSSNDTQVIDQETRLKPQETAATETVTVTVAKKANASSYPVLAAVKIERAEEHSYSSADQVVDPIKQAPENKSSSATNEDEVLKDHPQSDNMQEIVTTSQPFTTESLFEMCDESAKGRQTSREEKSKRLHLKAVVKAEPDINLLTEAEARQKEESASLNPGPVLIKKRQYKSNRDGNKGMNTRFIRNIKQKLGGKAGEIKVEQIQNTTTDIIIWGSEVPTQHLVNGSVISTSVSVSDLKKKTGKELRRIAKSLKITHYYKLKKDDLLQRLISIINHI